MNQPNPYEPPHLDSYRPTVVLSNTLIFTLSSEGSIEAVDDKDEVQFAFRRPISFVMDYTTILSGLTTLALSAAILFPLCIAVCQLAWAHQARLGELLTNLAVFTAAAICVFLQLWLARMVLYTITPRFEFSIFVENSPQTPLLTIHNRFAVRYRKLHVRNRLDAAVAKIHVRSNSYIAELSDSLQLSAIQLLLRADQSYSLTAQPVGNSVPKDLGTAKFLGNQLVFHSQLSPSMSEDEKLVALALIAIILINPAKSRLFSC